MGFKTRDLKIKSSVNVTTSATTIFNPDTDMGDNERIIQNLDSTILYISLGDDATTGTDGEIVLEQYGVFSTTFLGKISGIRNGAPSSSNNTSRVAI